MEPGGSGGTDRRLHRGLERDLFLRVARERLSGLALEQFQRLQVAPRPGSSSPSPPPPRPLVPRSSQTFCDFQAAVTVSGEGRFSGRAPRGRPAARRPHPRPDVLTRLPDGVRGPPVLLLAPPPRPAAGGPRRRGPRGRAGAVRADDRSDGVGEPLLGLRRAGRRQDHARLQGLQRAEGESARCCSRPGGGRAMRLTVTASEPGSSASTTPRGSSPPARGRRRFATSSRACFKCSRTPATSPRP